MKEDWSEIVFCLSKLKRKDLKELEYQREIERCLTLLGWKEYNGTLKSQVTIPIGNGNSIRPDIVLYKENVAILPIEIKKANIGCGSMVTLLSLKVHSKEGPIPQTAIMMRWI